MKDNGEHTTRESVAKFLSFHLIKNWVYLLSFSLYL